jgi:hypothetical protein
MNNKTERAEVSNRLIIVTGVLMVLVMLGVPLGYYIYPRIAERLRVKKKEKLELVFEETFEDPGWKGDGPLPREWSTWNRNTREAGTTDSRARTGKRSGRFFGQLNSMWSGGMYRDLPAGPPLVIEFDVWMGDEPFNKGAHPCRAGANFNPKGTGGSANYGPLMHFHADGYAYIIGEDKPVCAWKPKRWYHVRIRYEHDKDAFRITLEVDGKKMAGKKHKLTAGWRKKWDTVEIGFGSGAGTSFFDNIRVYRVVR